jgi:hypothetical protein
MEVAIDTDPELDYRRGVQSADHGIQFQPYLVCVVLGAKGCSHGAMGVDVEDDGITNLINDTGISLILYRYVKVVSRSGCHSDIALFIGGGQKSIESQVK